MAWECSVKMAVTTLSALLHSQGLGELPLLIRPEPVWDDVDEQRAVDAAALAELGRLRWADRLGHVDGDVVDWLRVLGHAPVEYGAVFEVDGAQYRVVVAAAGNDAVLAHCDGPMVDVVFLRDEFLPEILLRQLPDVPPAATPSVNMRRSDINSAEVFTRDGQALAKLVHQDLYGMGELYVGIRDRYGRRMISPPIRYQDYAIGRVLVVVSNGYLSVAPASKRLLLDRLHEARTALAA